MKKFDAGKFVQQGYYKSFEPTLINRDWMIDDMTVLQLLSQADRHLGRLDMYSEYVHIEHFIQMHITKEAVESSKIEGTQTNIEEAFLSKDEIHSEKRSDWEEVQNYISAMKDAVEMLHRLPFSSRLIKQTHKVLLQGVRSEHKMPGEYRISQNWIGGASINDAVFVPPHHASIAALMSDLEKFANDELNLLPDLLKVALIHYQFETIHPFLDGNGRVGRLLITIYFVSVGILKSPILYLSDFFERHRSLYYDNLMRVRTHNDMEQWIKFFLTGIIETAQTGVMTFDKILQLQKRLDVELKELGTRSGDAFKVVEQLYQKPVINAQSVSKIIDKSMSTAYSLISELEKRQILKEITGGERDRIYVFEEYIKLFKDEG